MAKLKVHAGDFSSTTDTVHVMFGNISIHDPMGGGFTGKTEAFAKFQIETIELASEESAIRLGGAAGWGAVGGVLLGPVGLLAGLLLGGKGKDVTFIMVLKDGRKMLATTDSKTYTKMQSVMF
ncbi:hypothetical protein ACWIT3_07915 [Pasteurella sp. P03HT]